MSKRWVSAAAVCVVLSGCVAALVAQNALAGLGVSEADAKRDIVDALSYGSVDVYPARAAFRAASPATRAALVKTAMAWARTYTESAAFKADYQRRRAEAAPQRPAARNVNDELAKQKAESAKAIEEAKKGLAQMPPDLRAEMAKTIKAMEAENAKRNADPEMAAMMREGAEAQLADEQRRYEQEMAEYEEKFPADPRKLVALRLREFLDMSKDVDYGARLVSRGGRQRFASEDYQSKPSEWKLCYRAGKDAVDAARAAAQAWLSAIEGK